MKKNSLLSSSVRSPYTFANVRCNRFSSTNGNNATPKTNINNSETDYHIVDMVNTVRKVFVLGDFSVRIQSKCGEIWTSKTPNKETFYAVQAT